MSSKPVEQLSQVIVRFAGDSGDGMQLTGSQFTSEAAILGNDISTLPDVPAEIRAPAGSLPGVSGLPLLVDSDAFSDRNLQKAGYAANPLEDGSLDEYQLHAVPLTTLTAGALK